MIITNFFVFKMLLVLCSLLIIKAIYVCYWFFVFFDDEWCLTYLLTKNEIRLKSLNGKNDD